MDQVSSGISLYRTKKSRHPRNYAFDNWRPFLETRFFQSMTERVRFAEIQTYTSVTRVPCVSGKKRCHQLALWQERMVFVFSPIPPIRKEASKQHSSCSSHIQGMHRITCVFSRPPRHSP